jgi:hypothetical protein
MMIPQQNRYYLPRAMLSQSMQDRRLTKAEVDSAIRPWASNADPIRNARCMDPVYHRALNELAGQSTFMGTQVRIDGDAREALQQMVRQPCSI